MSMERQESVGGNEDRERGVLEPIFDGLEALNRNAVDVDLLLTPIVEDEHQVKVTQTKLPCEIVRET